MIEALLIASTLYIPFCSWDKPGQDPYKGSLVAAVDSYKDIPEQTKARLKKRIEVRDYDDFATITQSGISGKYPYSPTISGMHFGGKGKVCGQVSTLTWTPTQVERGFVYCEDGFCLLIPTVCRNVSRIERLPSVLHQPVMPALPQHLPLLDSPVSVLPLSYLNPAPPEEVLPAWYPYPVVFLAPPAFCCVAPPPWRPLPHIPTIPEPSTFLLASIGAVLLHFLRRFVK